MKFLDYLVAVATNFFNAESDHKPEDPPIEPPPEKPHQGEPENSSNSSTTSDQFWQEDYYEYFDARTSTEEEEEDKTAAPEEEPVVKKEDDARFQVTFTDLHTSNSSSDSQIYHTPSNSNPQISIQISGGKIDFDVGHLKDNDRESAKDLQLKLKTLHNSLSEMEEAQGDCRGIKRRYPWQNYNLDALSKRVKAPQTYVNVQERIDMDVADSLKELSRLYEQEHTLLSKNV